MANESIVAVPLNLENPEVLKRFLRTLVERLDIVLGYRGTGNDAALTRNQLRDTEDTLTSVAKEVVGLTNGVEDNAESIRNNTTAIEVNTKDIKEVEKYWAPQELGADYYDYEFAGWVDLVGNFEFNVDGAAVTNPPYVALGGTMYRNFVHSVSTLNGGIVQRLVVIDSGTNIQAFQRAGNTFAEALAIGWLTL